MKVALLTALTILLVSLACSTTTSSDPEPDLQSTIIALEITKAFFENQPTQEQIQPIDQAEVVFPTSTVTMTPEARETPESNNQLSNVSFEGIQISFDPSIADSMNTTIIPGKNLGDDFMPGETYPSHFEFTLNGYAVSDHFQTPKILIYPVEEFRSISAYADEQFNNLQSALIQRPGGSSMSSLPFLPLWPAAQLFSSQVSYFDFQNGSGMRYLTMVGQDIYPVDNHHLFYTYQGITSDGQYYVSAVFPITHPGLPDDGFALIGDDYLSFSNNWENYIIETLRFLGEQSLESYFPSMLLLDEMMTSLKIDR
jgi:hypothetical protein